MAFSNAVRCHTCGAGQFPSSASEAEFSRGLPYGWARFARQPLIEGQAPVLDVLCPSCADRVVVTLQDISRGMADSIAKAPARRKRGT